ncbi:MAG: sigma factor G inhibitor Gin [Bacillota bacterium]
MKKTGNLLPVCLVCEETPVKGIRDGIILAGRFICERCQQELTIPGMPERRYYSVVQKFRDFLFS